MVTFYTSLHHEKSKWLFNVHEKNFFWTCSKVFLKEHQLKDKYVTKWKKCNKKKDIVTFLSNDSKVSIDLAINIRKLIWINVWNKKSISNKRKDKKVTKDLNKQICLFHGWNRGFETLWKVYFMTTHQFWNSGMQLLFYLIVIFLYILKQKQPEIKMKEMKE